MTNNRLLAQDLKEAKRLGRDQVVQSKHLKRQVRERLVRAGYLQEVIKGWYVLTMPGVQGSSGVWYSHYWGFIRHYLKERFGKKGYCLSPDHSLDLHAGETQIPSQLVVITKKTSNQSLELPFKGSLLFYCDQKKIPQRVIEKKGVSVMPVELALCLASPTYFKTKTDNIEILLKMISDISVVSKHLVEMDLVAGAQRLVEVCQKLGLNKFAGQIIADMKVIGRKIFYSDELANQSVLIFQNRYASPYSARIEMMWQRMRQDVIAIFPKVNNKKIARQITKIKDLYIHDAYHSLSIEGYQVTEELIEKVAQGKWDPIANASDKDLFSALSAKGYHECFKRVLVSYKKIKKPGALAQVFDEDLHDWYKTLFSPFVAAGIQKPTDLIGFRRAPVYIKDSMHVPIPSESVVDAMEKLVWLLKQEDHIGVKAVLGHFLFVFIHPYLDGNGRLARFLMNLILATGGYNWTVIRVTERHKYMQVLERASVKQDIVPFTKFIVSEMKYWQT